MTGSSRRAAQVRTTLPTLGMTTPAGKAMAALSPAIGGHASTPAAADLLAAFVRVSRDIEPTGAAQGLSDREIAAARRCVLQIDDWLDRFMNSLPRAVK